MKQKYTKEELEEARKFREKFGFKIPNWFARVFLLKEYWLAREGAIEVLTLAGEKSK